MGFYIRKGLTFGPLRLNLSRSGLGASFGVKGARVGTGPRGTYVHMGREGLYYRHTFSHEHAVESPTTPPQSQAVGPHDVAVIASATAATMADPSSGQVLADLNRIKKRVERYPWAITVGSILSICLFFVAPMWVFVLGVIATVVLSVWARHSDVSNGTAILNYHLDAGAESTFATLQSAFQQLAECDQIWSVDTSALVENVKYAAGAKTNFTTSVASVGFGSPPRVQSNLRVPNIKAGRIAIYFFPDRLFAYDPSGVGAVSYQQLKIESRRTNFVEAKRVPRDATKVGTTWRYVNKKGGPDRRFRDNPHYPVVLYGLIGLESNTGLKMALMCSKQDAGDRFCQTFPHAMAKATVATIPEKPGGV